MTKYELKSIINECIEEIIYEGTDDRLTQWYNQKKPVIEKFCNTIKTKYNIPDAQAVCKIKGNEIMIVKGSVGPDNDDVLMNVMGDVELKLMKSLKPYEWGANENAINGKFTATVRPFK